MKLHLELVGKELVGLAAFAWLVACDHSESTLKSTDSVAAKAITLRETASVEIAGDLQVIGGISRTNQFVIWTPNRVLRYTSGSPVVPLCPLFVKHPIQAAFTSDGEIEVIDAASKSRLRISPNGMCRIANFLQGWGTVTSASFNAGSWVVLGTDNTGRLIVRAYAFSGQETWSFGPALANQAMPSGWLYVVHLGSRVIVGLHQAPFRWVIMDTAGAILSRWSAGEKLPASEETPFSSDRWFASNVVPLDSELFLQTLADVKSDRRVLVSFSMNGLRAREISVPLGVLSANMGVHRLMMLRRTDRLEIVTYDWAK